MEFFALYLRGFLIHSRTKIATFVVMKDLADGTKNTTGEHTEKAIKLTTRACNLPHREMSLTEN